MNLIKIIKNVWYLWYLNFELMFFFKLFIFYFYKLVIFLGNIYKRNVNIDDVKEWKVFRVLFLDMDRGK